MYAVVVAAGGTSRRYGSDKLALLLADVVGGLPPDAQPVVCVGPARTTGRRTDVRWVREDPPLGGPLAAVAAGVESLTETDPDVVVLAGGDMPYVGRALPSLVAAVAACGVDVDCAALVDVTGRRQPLASAWRREALLAALERLGPAAGLPLHRLLDGARVVEVADAWGAALDVDTPSDLPPQTSS